MLPIRFSPSHLFFKMDNLAAYIFLCRSYSMICLITLFFLMSRGFKLLIEVCVTEFINFLCTLLQNTLNSSRKQKFQQWSSFPLAVKLIESTSNLLNMLAISHWNIEQTSHDLSDLLLFNLLISYWKWFISMPDWKNSSDFSPVKNDLCTSFP